jgi:FKBP-type peptidyl-prolyl cis-trans isomerase
MKISPRLLAAVLILGVRAGFAAEAVAPPAPAPAYTRDEIIEAWGWSIAYERRVAQVQLSEAELALFLRGADAGFHGQPAPSDSLKIFPDVQKLAKARRENFVRTLTERNRAEWRAFLARRQQEATLVALPGGLWYEVLKPGRGPTARPQQTANIRYVGRLPNGAEFFQFGPIEEVLTPLRISDYLCAGLQQMSPGGEIRLYVPSPASDRDGEKLGIPPGSTMVFDLELLGVRETTPAELADALAAPAPEPPPPPPSGYAEAQIIEAWGWTVARQSRVADLAFDEADLARLTQGLVAGIRGQPLPPDFAQIGPAVAQFVADCREQARLAFKAKQLAAAEAFFAGLKNNPHIVELPSGLRYEIVKPGEGPYPRLGSTLRVYYVGRLLNGKQFDEREKSAPPALVVIKSKPAGWVIAGWNEGLQKINRGGIIRLYVPASLGYGAEAYHTVPPYSALVYEIEIVDVQAPHP